MANGSKALSVTLKALGLSCGAVGTLHVALGLQADALIGAGSFVELLADGGLDSQNRFYGAVFALCGAVMWLAATDLPRYAPVLAWALGLTFLGGAARLISVALYGWPAPPIIALGISELTLPPLLGWWARRQLAARHEPLVTT